jgi:hypothetical protein
MSRMDDRDASELPTLSSTLTLVLAGHSYPVPARVFPELLAGSRIREFEIHSRVTRTILRALIYHLKTRIPLLFTRQNLEGFLNLAEELELTSVSVDCAGFALTEAHRLRLRVRHVSISAPPPEDADLLRKLDLMLATKRQAVQLPPPAFAEYLYSRSRPLDGIVHYLVLKYGLPLPDEVLAVRSHSQWDRHGTFPPSMVLDLELDTCFRSRDDPQEWILWHFKTNRVKLERYTLRAYCLKSWCLSGSNDGSEWITLSVHGNDTAFDDGLKTASFVVEHQAEYHWIRLMQTSPNPERDHPNRLDLAAVEFFGLFFD